MPPVVTAVAITLAGGGFAVPTFAQFVVAKIIVGAVAAIGVSALTGSLTKKPKLPDVQGFQAAVRDRTITARQPISPRRIVYGKVRAGGVYAFIHTTGTGNEFIHLVVMLAGHQIAGVDAMYFNGEEVPVDDSGNATGEYAGFARVKYKLGSDDQTAFEDLVSEAGDKWTTDHRLRGCAAAYVRLKYDGDKFPNGIPNLTFLIRGKNDIYDPRTGQSGYTANAALCLADYISDDRLGLGAAYGTEILTDDLIAAANICDERVLTADGSPTEDEARYESNGTITLDKSPYDIILGLAGSMAGYAIAQGRLWSIQAGAYSSPVMTLTQSDLVGNITVSTLISRKDSFNGVRGTFAGPDTDWQPDDFPPVQVAGYVTADGGIESWNDVTLSFTSSSYAAQRIARILLEQQRRQIVVTAEWKTKAYRLQPGDTVALTIDRYGWTAKTFRVKSVSLNIGETITVNLDLQETDANVYAWTTADQQVYLPAPRTALPSPFNVEAPGIPSVTEELYETRSGGGVKARAIAVTSVSDPRVRELEWQFRIITDAEWTSAGKTEQARAVIDDVKPGVYEVRVRGISDIGVRSAWATRTPVEIAGLGAKPADITNFTITQAGGLAILRWDLHPDLDVRIGGKIHIRHTQDTISPSWALSQSIGPAVEGNITQTVLPLKPGTYLVRAVDTTGNWSENPATFIATGAQAVAFTNLTSLSAHPGFFGTKVNTIAAGGTLSLEAASAIDDWADVDAVEIWDWEGGVTSSGSYTFASGIDLTTVKRVRLRSTLTTEIVNVLDLIDLRPGNVDDWDDWDGFIIGDEADLEMQFRETDDDPAGAPVWSEWARFDSAEIEARALEFRAVLSSLDSAYTIQCTEMTANVDEVV